MAKPSLRQQTGFTLVEVLIALAITGMVVSVLMGSVFYGAKVQSGMRQELIEREQLLRGKAWFFEVLSTCLPAEVPSGSAFEGSSQQIVCDTLMPLQGSRVLGSQRVTLVLKRRPVGDGIQLLYSPVSSTSAPVVLNEFAADEAHFTFIAANDKTYAKWPVQINDPETLPARVELNLKGAGADSKNTVWTVSLRASPWLEPKARLPFGSSVLQ
jgi:prepilin-type N-terminal cleavage/methylation domain-containing protein